MLCLVYTFVFRSDVLWCVAFYVLQYTTTIPITSHHVTYYSVFATKKTITHKRLDILASCYTNVTILLKQQKNRVYFAKLCDIFNDLYHYMVLCATKKHLINVGCLQKNYPVPLFYPNPIIV